MSLSFLEERGNAHFLSPISACQTRSEGDGTRSPPPLPPCSCSCHRSPRLRSRSLPARRSAIALSAISLFRSARAFPRRPPQIGFLLPSFPVPSRRISRLPTRGRRGVRPESCSRLTGSAAVLLPPPHTSTIGGVLRLCFPAVNSSSWRPCFRGFFAGAEFVPVTSVKLNFLATVWIHLMQTIDGRKFGGVSCHSFLRGDEGLAVKEKLEISAGPLSKGPNDPPVFAYWISGGGGDGKRILRLLKAVYHPRNRYLLHLDASCSPLERSYLVHSVKSQKIFKSFGNVDVIGRSYGVDRTGPSTVAATLHGAAILLRLHADWDWFITLSASDYPLVSQDDLLHVFTVLPRNLNFIDHTSDLGWKERERFDKVAVDPSLYMKEKEKLLISTDVRATPNAFKIFTGSPWVILSRPFVEHCVHGSDNFPRKLLLYYSNTIYSMEAYFQTLICNSPEFKNTTVNNDLRYFIWNDPPGLEPLFLNRTHLKSMIKSRAAFARKFKRDDPVLKDLDERMLGHKVSRTELRDNYINMVTPSPSAMMLKSLVTELISSERFRSSQCKF